MRKLIEGVILGEALIGAVLNTLQAEGYISLQDDEKGSPDNPSFADVTEPAQEADRDYVAQAAEDPHVIRATADVGWEAREREERAFQRTQMQLEAERHMRLHALQSALSLTSMSGNVDSAVVQVNAERFANFLIYGGTSGNAKAH